MPVNTFANLTLTTARLLLRPLVQEDAHALFAIFTEPTFVEFNPLPIWTSVDEAKEVIEADQKYMAQGLHLRLGIERQSDQCVMGICTLFNFDKDCQKASIGYGLNSLYRLNGYVAEALGAIFEYAFTTLKLNRIEADIDPRNARSANSLLRSGFKKEGLLRQNCRLKGALADSELYGLLKGDWTSQPTAFTNPR